MFTDFTLIWELCYTIIHTALFPHTIQKISTYSRDRKGCEEKNSTLNKQHRYSVWQTIQQNVLCIFHSINCTISSTADIDSRCIYFKELLEWYFYLPKGQPDLTKFGPTGSPKICRAAPLRIMWKFSTLYVLKQEASSTSLRSN